MPEIPTKIILFGSLNLVQHAQSSIHVNKKLRIVDKKESTHINIICMVSSVGSILC